METKIDLKILQQVEEKCSFVDGICLSNKGLSGVLGFWWRDINVRLVSYLAHHVLVEVCDGNDVPIWAVVGIYGWPKTENKYLTWSLMRSHKEVTPLPIIFLGTLMKFFMVWRKKEELLGEKDFLTLFREVVEVCDFRDLGF